MSSNGLILGLTGGIGCGKSAVSDWLIAQGVTVVDADIVAREVVEPNSEALRSIAGHFGLEILTSEGALNRAALRAKVFADPGERQWLEALLHPLIRKEILRQLKTANSAYRVLSSPLLLETDQWQLVDRIAVIDLPEALQITRACIRDGNDEQQIKRIMAAQLRREARLQRADYILDNSGTREQLYQQLDRLHNRLLAESSGASHEPKTP